MAILFMWQSFVHHSHRGSTQNLALIVQVVLDMFELVAEQQTEDRQWNDCWAWVYYKPTWWAFGSGELNSCCFSSSVYISFFWLLCDNASFSSQSTRLWYKRVQQATHFNPVISMIPDYRFVPSLPYYNIVFKLNDNGMSLLLLRNSVLYFIWLQPTFDNCLLDSYHTCSSNW